MYCFSQRRIGTIAERLCAGARGISKKSLSYINGDLRQIGFREIFVLIVAYDNQSIRRYLFELMSQTLQAVTDMRIARLEIFDRFQRNLRLLWRNTSVARSMALTVARAVITPVRGIHQRRGVR